MGPEPLDMVSGEEALGDAFLEVLSNMVVIASENESTAVLDCIHSVSNARPPVEAYLRLICIPTRPSVCPGR